MSSTTTLCCNTPCGHQAFHNRPSAYCTNNRLYVTYLLPPKAIKDAASCRSRFGIRNRSGIWRNRRCIGNRWNIRKRVGCRRRRFRSWWNIGKRVWCGIRFINKRNLYHLRLALCQIVRDSNTNLLLLQAVISGNSGVELVTAILGRCTSVLFPWAQRVFPPAASTTRQVVWQCGLWSNRDG